VTSVGVRVTATAPGVVKLFGEHAVVYGKPAIAMAIDKGVRVTVERQGEDSLLVVARDLVAVRGVAIRVTGGSIEGSVIDGPQLAKLASYALTALRIVSEGYGGDLKGIKVTIESQLPIGAGLATSAAVSVATTVAYAKLIGVELSREEVAKLSHKVELTVQGSASPMDTATSSLGGVVYIMATPLTTKSLATTSSESPPCLSTVTLTPLSIAMAIAGLP